jgi:hypothetical protein
MALLIMALAIAFLPHPGYLLLVGTAMVGLIIGVWRIRRSDTGSSAVQIAASGPGGRPTRAELERS